MGIIKNVTRKLVRWVRPVDELTAWKKRLARDKLREFELAFECHVQLTSKEPIDVAVRVRQLERLENHQNCMGERPGRRAQTIETKRSLRGQQPLMK